MQLRHFVLIAAGLVACSGEPDRPRALPGDGASRARQRRERSRGESRRSRRRPASRSWATDSAGCTWKRRQAFPAILQRELAEQGHPFKLINAGRQRDTSAGGCGASSWLLSRSRCGRDELGGNEACATRARRHREQPARDRAQVKDAARAAVARHAAAAELRAEYTSGFEKLYERVAKARTSPSSHA